jgi:hypothetical protein
LTPLSRKSPEIAGERTVIKTKQEKISAMKIGVFGSASEEKALFEHAEKIGKRIASKGAILITGACPGIPQEAVLAAKAGGGETIGFSPWASEAEHKANGFPIAGFSRIIYTGAGKKGRNVLSVRECDAAIIINGRIGTLNEFTIAYDEGKVVGVLKGSGRIADLIPEIVRVSGKPTSSQLIFEEQPERLVDRVVETLGKPQARPFNKRFS